MLTIMVDDNEYTNNRKKYNGYENNTGGIPTPSRPANSHCPGLQWISHIEVYEITQTCV